MGGSQAGVPKNSWKFPAGNLFKCMSVEYKRMGMNESRLVETFEKIFPYWKEFFKKPITSHALHERGARGILYANETPEENPGMQPYWGLAQKLVKANKFVPKNELLKMLGDNSNEPVDLEEAVDLAEANPTSGKKKYLYVLASLTLPNHSGIGVSNNPPKRIKGYSKGSLDNSLTFKVFKCEDAEEIEDAIKQDLKRHTNGGSNEVFTFPPITLCGLVLSTAYHLQQGIQEVILNKNGDEI